MGQHSTTTLGGGQLQHMKEMLFIIQGLELQSMKFVSYKSN